MNIHKILKVAEKFTVDNSPLILTAMGAAGVLTTGILAAKGGSQAKTLIDAECERRKWQKAGDSQKAVFITDFEVLTPKEKAVLTWQCYAPACGVGLVTIAAIVGANRISTKRAAAMAAAYSLTTEAFDEYVKKVQDKLGDKKENAVRDDVAQARVITNPPTDDNITVVTSAADPLFQDSWSSRYLRTNAEAVRQAVNELNFKVNAYGSATLSDFYELLGLSKTAESDEIGWNSDKLLDVYFAAVVHENGKVPVMAIEYRVIPIRDYFRTR